MFVSRLLTAATFTIAITAIASAVDASPITFSSTGAPIPIPDDNAAGANSIITVPHGFSFTDLNIGLNITHTWVGDLSVTLTHVASGTSVELLHRAGGATCSRNNINAVLDDSAAVAGNTMCDPGPPAITGAVSPLSPLAAFNGVDPEGDWRLNVIDSALIDTGTLDSWSLEFTSTFPLYISSPGLAIPDDNSVGVSDTITVPDSFAIADVNVWLDVTHTWDGDLSFSLLHIPSGVAVPLLNRAGGATCSRNNINVLLDDSSFIAGNTMCDPAGAFGIHGTVAPLSLLSAFNGLNAQGDWRLTASDNASIDTGRLNSWSVEFTPAADPSPVPEPATLVLTTFGLTGIAARRLRRRSR